jgi:hypothetical protein
MRQIHKARESQSSSYVTMILMKDNKIYMKNWPNGLDKTYLRESISLTLLTTCIAGESAD